MLGTSSPARRNPSRRSTWAALMLGSLALIAAACGGGDSESTSETPAPTAAPNHDGSPDHHGGPNSNHYDHDNYDHGTTCGGHPR